MTDSTNEAKEDIVEERKGFFIVTIDVKSIVEIVKGIANYMKSFFLGIFILLLSSTAFGQNCPKGQEVYGVLTSDVTDTTATTVIAAQASGVRTYLDAACVQNSHSTVGTWVNFLDGSTVKGVCYAAVLGGGCCVPIKTPLRGTAATAWKIQAVTTGAAIRGHMYGCKSTQ